MQKGYVVLILTVFTLVFSTSAVFWFVHADEVTGRAEVLFHQWANERPTLASSGNQSIDGNLSAVASELEAYKSQLTLAPDTNHNHLAAAHAYPAEQVQRWMVSGATDADFPTDKKLCFLTFDDGPSEEITPLMLDVLRDKKAYGTFFVVGPEMTEEKRDLVTRMITEGHGLALHTWSHDYRTLYPRKTANANAISQDYTTLLTHMNGFLGADYRTGAFRYPGGHMSWKGLATADQWMQSQGYYWIDWNVSTADAAPGRGHAKNLIANVQQQVKPDQRIAVILMHDSKDKQHTVEALPHIIDHMAGMGFEFAIIA